MFGFMQAKKQAIGELRETAEQLFYLADRIEAGEFILLKYPYPGGATVDIDFYKDEVSAVDVDVRIRQVWQKTSPSTLRDSHHPLRHVVLEMEDCE